MRNHLPTDSIPPTSCLCLMPLLSVRLLRQADSRATKVRIRNLGSSVIPASIAMPTMSNRVSNQILSIGSSGLRVQKAITDLEVKAAELTRRANGWPGSRQEESKMKRVTHAALDASRLSSRLKRFSNSLFFLSLRKPCFECAAHDYNCTQGHQCPSQKSNQNERYDQ